MRPPLMLFMVAALLLTAGCIGGNDDQVFKSLVEQLNQKGLQTKDTIQNADGSYNKAVIEDMIKTYNDARTKIVSMKLSDAYSGARDNYIKGIDEATAGYSALIKIDPKQGLGALAGIGTTMQRFTNAQSYFDSAKRVIGVPVT
jgi:hypothetical protein